MTELLTTLEEYDAIMRLQNPHLLFAQEDISARKKIAYLIMQKKEDEILLLSPDALSSSSVIAGLTEKNIEHLTKHGPQAYKQSILSALSNQETINEAWEIAQAMDNDRENSQRANQNRINTLLRYIKDNLTVFEF